MQVVLSTRGGDSYRRVETETGTVRKLVKSLPWQLECNPSEDFGSQCSTQLRVRGNAGVFTPSSC